MKWLIVLIVCSWQVLGSYCYTANYNISAIDDGELKAAPGLEGFGSTTSAGRGGRVLVITNLQDSGPGSARAALEAEGPRQVISNVAGAIRLTTPIYIKSHCSFYGQVAPGEGLTFLMDSPNKYEASIVVSKAADILVQYIRVRGIARGSYRNLTVLNGKRVVIDHCSFSWSTDQNLNSWFVNEDLTFSNNLSYEGLLVNSGVAKPTLFGYTDSRGISIHHNVFAHGIGRMPMVADMDLFSIEWNMIYNPGNWATQVTTQKKPQNTIRGNIRNNWYHRLQTLKPMGHEIQLRGTAGPIEAYLENNYLLNEDRETRLSRTSLGYKELTQAVAVAQVNAPPGVSVKTLPSQLLPHVGASLPKRDRNDLRVIGEIQNHRGRMIQALGGKGPKKQAFLPVETIIGNSLLDLNSIDAVPDSWKIRHGIEPGTDLTKQDSNGDGYSDWEDWRIEMFER